MPPKANLDPRVDTYITEAEPFAQPILRHLRKIVHAACPNAQEAIKWNMPFFVLEGRNVCHMAAFKAHCGFGFWAPETASLVAKEVTPKVEAMGLFGRITRIEDLPPARDLTRYVKHAAEVARAKAKGPKRSAAKPKNTQRRRHSSR